MDASILIGCYAGLLGLLVGLIVSASAAEELTEGKKYFQYLRDLLFLFLAGLFCYQAGFIALIIGLLLALALLVKTGAQESSDLICLLSIIMLLLLREAPLWPILVALFFLIGIFDAGLWSARNEKLARKGIFSGQLWRAALSSQVVYVLLPLASTILVI